LNVSKTNFILFSNHKSQNVHHEIILENKPIKKVSTTKFLGVELDSKLSWKDHIRLLEKKISSSLFILRKIRFKINEETAFLLYDAMILPHITYCNIIWSNTFKSNLKHLFSLQKQCIRICFKRNCIPKTQLLFSKSGKLKLDDIQKLQTAIIIFKFFNLNHSLPNVISHLFQKITDIHFYSTRSRDTLNLHTFPCSTNIRKFTTKFSGPTIWNSIPLTIRIHNTLNQFKKYYKIYLMQNVSDSI